MRVAFVGLRGVPALYGGFETAVTEIGMRLVERGHEVIVYCRKGYGDESEPTYKGIEKKYLPQINLKVAGTLSHTFFSLVHLFFRPSDVIIVMNPANGPLCIIPRVRGTPFGINVDGLEWKRGKWPPIGQKYFWFASWFCTKIAPAVIADSHAIQEFYKKTWNAETYYASYGAYIEQSTDPQLLEEYGLVRDDYFVVVARLEPENNTDLIIKAFEGVKTVKKLVIIGGTNYKSIFVENLKKTRDERVLFLGTIYDQKRLTEIMCNCFAYVHGHMVGGTNPVLLKALGCRSCVLFLDVPFNTEVVQDAGIPYAKTVAGLRGEMQALVDNPERVHQYRRLAPERIRQEYTWNHIADRYEELCYKLHGAK